MKSIFSTVFRYGVSHQICSTHKTIKAARKAAKKCEARGGAKHSIWEIKKHKV